MRRTIDVHRWRAALRRRKSTGKSHGSDHSDEANCEQDDIKERLIRRDDIGRRQVLRTVDACRRSIGERCTNASRPITSSFAAHQTSTTSRHILYCRVIVFVAKRIQKKSNKRAAGVLCVQAARHKMQLESLLKSGAATVANKTLNMKTHKHGLLNRIAKPSLDVSEAADVDDALSFASGKHQAAQNQPEIEMLDIKRTAHRDKTTTTTTTTQQTFAMTDASRCIGGGRGARRRRRHCRRRRRSRRCCIGRRYVTSVLSRHERQTTTDLFGIVPAARAASSSPSANACTDDDGSIITHA